jgi:hypothetical protein
MCPGVLLVNGGRGNSVRRVEEKQNLEAASDRESFCEEGGNVDAFGSICEYIGRPENRNYVHVCVYVCMCVCVYVCMYVCVCVYVCVCMKSFCEERGNVDAFGSNCVYIGCLENLKYVYVQACDVQTGCMYVCMYVCMCGNRKYVSVHACNLCMHAFMYVCVHVHMYEIILCREASC